MPDIKNINNSLKVDNSFDVWKLWELNDTAILRINLESGTTLDAHINDQTVVFYVLQGSGELTIDEDTFLLNVNDSIEVEKGSTRSWKVINDDNLELLVVKFL